MTPKLDFRAIAEKKINSYRKTFRTFGQDAKALQWRDNKSQTLRFKELLKDLDLEGKSILDFGCGFGDIIPELSVKYRTFEYFGIDVVPEFIFAASNTYENRSKFRNNIKLKFLVRDYLNNPLRRKFDVILSSGTLNANLDDPLRYRKNAIRILWEHAEETLAFNMSGGFPQPENKKDNRVFYANSLEILEYCLSLTSRIIFRHNYRKNDFTIIMFR